MEEKEEIKFIKPKRKYVRQTRPDGTLVPRYSKELIPMLEMMPDWYDTRDWRLQVYSWLEECANKYNTTVYHLLRSCGYDKPKHRVWAMKMKGGYKDYSLINMVMIQSISRKTGVPFYIM